jgi:hypothetical protein
MKKISMLIVAMLLSAGASAEKIYLAHTAGPGGTKQAQIQALQEKLEAAGHTIEVVNTNSCRSAENWIKRNPGKPVITSHSIEDAAYGKNFPGTEHSCDIPLTRESLIAVASTAYLNVCSMDSVTAGLEKFKRGGNKIAVTYFPYGINEYLATGLVKNLKLENTRVVKYPDGAKTIQALVSRDVDFVLMSSAHLVTKSGGNCFMTLAPRNQARDGILSLEEFSPGNAWVGKSHTFTFVGFNLKNKSIIRKITVDTINTHATFTSQFQLNAHKVGVAAGQTEEQQWRWVDNALKGYGNLKID